MFSVKFSSDNLPPVSNVLFPPLTLLVPSEKISDESLERELTHSLRPDIQLTWLGPRWESWTLPDWSSVSSGTPHRGHSPPCPPRRPPPAPPPPRPSGGGGGPGQTGPSAGPRRTFSGGCRSRLWESCSGCCLACK